MFLAAGIGLTHGTLITKVKMQPFIVTLCGLLLYRGLARYIANDNTLGFGKAEGFEWLKELSTGSYLSIPNPLWVLMVVAVIMFFVLHRTSFGRYLFAVGANEEAARYAGIPSARIITIAYVLCSLLAGLASVLLGFYTNSISPSGHGNFYELYAIAAAVLGGCSLRGGEGSIVGILLGTALLQALRNMVNLLKIPSSLEFAVMGVVILLGVLADSLVRKKKA
jgi:ribose transport system permease protein